MDKASVELTLYDAHTGSTPIVHNFVATASTAPLEYSFLQKIKEMVSPHFSMGMPLHRLESARDRVLRPGQSSIFVVEWADFDKMESREIQEIFRYRHILVVNWPEKTIKFDRAGLSLLAPMKKQKEFQGKLSDIARFIYLFVL
jgi:hypothetical protein